MAESKVKDGNYYVVQSFMVKDLKLKGLEKDVYAIIYGFSQAGQKFNGSLQYLADWTTSTKQGVLKSLKSLQDKDLIIKEDKQFNGVKFCEYYTTEFNTSVNKVEEGIKQSLTEGIKQSLPNNISSNTKDIKEKNIDTFQSEEIIFDFWNSKKIVQHREMTNPMIKQITKSIKEYGIDNIKKYIDRYAEVVHDKTYYFDTKWTLIEFLKQSNGISTFTDEGSKWLNYLERNNKSNQSEQPVKEQNLDFDRRYGTVL